MGQGTQPGDKQLHTVWNGRSSYWRWERAREGADEESREVLEQRQPGPEAAIYPIAQLWGTYREPLGRGGHNHLIYIVGRLF